MKTEAKRGPSGLQWWAFVMLTIVSTILGGCGVATQATRHTIQSAVQAHQSPQEREIAYLQQIADAEAQSRRFVEAQRREAVREREAAVVEVERLHLELSMRPPAPTSADILARLDDQAAHAAGVPSQRARVVERPPMRRAVARQIPVPHVQPVVRREPEHEPARPLLDFSCSAPTAYGHGWSAFCSATGSNIVERMSRAARAFAGMTTVSLEALAPRLNRVRIGLAALMAANVSNRVNGSPFILACRKTTIDRRHPYFVQRFGKRHHLSDVTFATFRNDTQSVCGTNRTTIWAVSGARIRIPFGRARPELMSQAHIGSLARRA